MAFTGLLVLARTTRPVTGLLSSLEADLISHRTDDWQLVQLLDHTEDVHVVVASLVNLTAAPVLAAAIDDSTSALVVADSPDQRRWTAMLNDPDTTPDRARAHATQIADTVTAWEPKPDTRCRPKPWSRRSTSLTARTARWTRHSTPPPETSRR